MADLRTLPALAPCGIKLPAEKSMKDLGQGRAPSLRHAAKIQEQITMLPRKNQCCPPSQDKARCRFLKMQPCWASSLDWNMSES